MGPRGAPRGPKVKVKVKVQVKVKFKVKVMRGNLGGLGDLEEEEDEHN